MLPAAARSPAASSIAGRVSPGLRGMYLYGGLLQRADLGRWRRQGGGWNNRQLLASGFNITTFGEDEAGEIYVANGGNGTVYRIEGSRAPRFTADGRGQCGQLRGGMVAGSLATVFAAGVRDDAGSLVAAAVPLPGENSAASR